MRETLKKNRLLADFLGYACIFAVPFVGWLPGPGGIPLLLTGLSLLSIHNAWARQATNYVKKHSSHLREILFPPEIHIMRAWDVASFIGLIGVVLIPRYTKHPIGYSFSGVLFFGIITILLCNRNRLEHLKKRLKKP